MSNFKMYPSPTFNTKCAQELKIQKNIFSLLLRPKYLIFFFILGFVSAQGNILKSEITSPSQKKPTVSKKIPKWKLEKAALDEEKKVGEKFIGKYRRGNPDEIIEFYFNKKNRLKGRYVGFNRFDYEFSITDVKLIDERTIEYKVKGKWHRAMRIDESLQLVYPTGQIQYCPKIGETALTIN